ncbi:MAG TPA: beta-ketoacyl-ACP synthase III [Spirochaetales bacterium]|nr:beta-ketoacyl-ACP synthase III [Spirochaetales bacterium]
MAVIVKSLGSFVPENRVTNDELAKRVDTDDEWIRSHTGIGARHFAADGETTTDLAERAIRAALERAGVDPSELGLIVVASASPEFFGFPSTACILQDRLGAREAAAFDVNAGCTGFIYALEVARSMLESGEARYAVAVGAETLSRISDWNDRATCVLFGDGAGCALLEKVEGNAKSAPGGRGLLKSILRAEGSGAKDLYLTQPDRTRTFERPAFEGPMSIVMNGKNVYTFAVRTITQLIEQLSTGSGFKLEDFRWIVPHQANLRIVQAAAKRFGLSESRFYMNIEEYANTSAASIPLALDEMRAKGLLVEGDLVMLLGFGAGLTYGGTVARM